MTDRQRPDLPPCRCGAVRWTECGGSLGGIVQRSYQCAECNRGAMAVWHEGGNAFLIAAVACSDMAAECAYVNATMMTVWDDRAIKLRVPRAAHELAFRRAVNLTLGLPADARGTDVPEAHRDEWHRRMESNRAAPEWRAPPGFERAPELARIPEGLCAWVKQPDGWERADAARNRDLPIPPDPTRVRHDEWFAGLFAAVRWATGATIEPREIQNRYWRDEYRKEPWYEFEIHGARFVVGPRKRVVSVRVSGLSSTVHLSILGDIGTRDGVTCCPESSGIELHAHGREKAFEYLCAMIRAAMDQTP